MAKGINRRAFLTAGPAAFAGVGQRAHSKLQGAQKPVGRINANAIGFVPTPTGDKRLIFREMLSKLDKVYQSYTYKTSLQGTVVGFSAGGGIGAALGALTFIIVNFLKKRSTAPEQNLSRRDYFKSLGTVAFLGTSLGSFLGWFSALGWRSPGWYPRVEGKWAKGLLGPDQLTKTERNADQYFNGLGPAEGIAFQELKQIFQNSIATISFDQPRKSGVFIIQPSIILGHLPYAYRLIEEGPKPGKDPVTFQALVDATRELENRLLTQIGLQAIPPRDPSQTYEEVEKSFVSAHFTYLNLD